MPRYSARLTEALRQAKHVAILTGAGVSAESGIPTFRDPLVGLWERFDPGELATPEAFRRDPDLVWGWYEWRRMLVARAQPNAAHRAIAQMSEFVPTLSLITQNVDDLHERAGSKDVLHLHGQLAEPYCEACRQPFVPPLAMPNLPAGGARVESPRCASCSGRVRPGVVWFGEDLPSKPWTAAREAAGRCEVFLCVGTSSVVQPAASLTGMAARSGAITVQVNPHHTEIDDAVSFSLKGPAGKILPELVAEVWGPGTAPVGGTDA